MAESPECFAGMCVACVCENSCSCECHFEPEGRYEGVADDEWCPDCGESLPCMCDDYYDEDDECEDSLP